MITYMKEPEILNAVNGFYAKIKEIDPDFVLKKGRDEFLLEKTIEGVTKRIKIDLLDPPSWHYRKDNDPMSCKGFIINSSDLNHWHHDNRTNPRIMPNKLEKFNDIAQPLVDEINRQINKELQENITGCRCDVRSNNIGKYGQGNWKKVLSYLDLPYYKPIHYEVGRYTTSHIGKVRLEFQRDFKALNHPFLSPTITGIDETQFYLIQGLVMKHKNDLESFNFSGSGNSSISFLFNVTLHKIKLSLFKQIIILIRDDLQFMEDAKE